MIEEKMQSHGHICCRCGWSYANSHPSAKQRRAHKKVCGNLQGFKILKPQDEKDPLFEVTGSGLFGRQVSNKSEEEEFSDAVSDFSEADLRRSNSFGIQLSDTPNDDNSSRTPEALKNVVSQLEGEAQFKYHSTRSTVDSVVGLVTDKEVKSSTFHVQEANGCASAVFIKNEGSEDVHIAKAVDTEEKRDSNGNLSVLEPLFHESASKEFEGVADLQKMDGPDVSDASNTNIALPMDLVVDLKEMETDALGQKAPVNEVLSGTCSCPVESGAIANVCSSEDSSPVEVNSTIKSGIENHNDDVDAGYSIELSKLSKPAYVPSEELPELIVTATKKSLPVKSEVSPSTCCGEATAEMKDQSCLSEGAHSGLLSSVTSESGDVALLPSVLEENHQHEVVCSKNMAEGASTGHEADVSEAKDWNESPESHEMEGFPGSTACKTAISGIEVNEQEPIYSQQDISLKSLPQAVTVRAADGIVSPEDTVVHEPMVAVSGKDGSLHEEARKSNADDAGNFIEEEKIAAENSIVSPEDAVLHEAVDSISGKSGAIYEEARQGNPDNAVNYNGKGALEENSMQWKINCETDFEESLRETISIPPKRIGDSNAVVMEASQLQKTIESVSDLQDCQGENLVESSKEVETKNTVSKTDQVKYVGADCSIAGPLQEGRKSDFGTELDVFHSAENTPIKEPVSPALDSVPCDLQSSSLKDGTEVLVSGDVSSPSLKEDENLLLENQLEALTNTPFDSISQTDSVEGCWGSVSDGTVRSSRHAVNSSSILAADTLGGTDSSAVKEENQVPELKRMSSSTGIFEAPSLMTLIESCRGNTQQSASEIQAIKSLQQSHASSSQAGLCPSLNRANIESQGRKKNEEIIEKVANWSPGRIRAPLKSFLVEPNFESKQEAALHGDPRLPPQKDDAATTLDNDAHTEFVPPVAAPGVSTNNGLKRNVEKGWNSPARLPSRQKRKLRWSPFLCCLSVN